MVSMSRLEAGSESELTGLRMETLAMFLPSGMVYRKLRLDFGPGYRVYFGQNGDEVHLICGGFKDSQPNDIKFAKEFWRTHV